MLAVGDLNKPPGPRRLHPPLKKPPPPPSTPPRRRWAPASSGKPLPADDLRGRSLITRLRSQRLPVLGLRREGAGDRESHLSLEALPSVLRDLLARFPVHARHLRRAASSQSRDDVVNGDNMSTHFAGWRLDGRRHEVSGGAVLPEEMNSSHREKLIARSCN